LNPYAVGTYCDVEVAALVVASVDVAAERELAELAELATISGVAIPSLVEAAATELAQAPEKHSQKRP
jgi:hypothetical protein